MIDINEELVARKEPARQYTIWLNDILIGTWDNWEGAMDCHGAFVNVIRKHRPDEITKVEMKNIENQVLASYYKW